MTKKEAILKSIAHWERMIEWAKKQKKEAGFNVFYMSENGGENIGASGCSLCSEYGCHACPLYIAYGYCSPNESNNYFKTRESKTYGIFVKNATLMLKQLKSLPY